MELRPIPCYPGYFAGTDGRIYSNKRKYRGNYYLLFLELRRGSHYLIVTLCHQGKPARRRVHGLVLRAFHGQKPFPAAMCRHINGIPLDNRPGNLMWGTARENILDQITHGHRRVSEHHHGSKFSRARVRKCRELYQSGVQQKEIGRRLHMARSTVCGICNGKTRRYE